MSIDGKRCLADCDGEGPGAGEDDTNDPGVCVCGSNSLEASDLSGCVNECPEGEFVSVDEMRCQEACDDTTEMEGTISFGGDDVDACVCNDAGGYELSPISLECEQADSGCTDASLPFCGICTGGRCLQC